jgi:hypothetical protein
MAYLLFYNLGTWHFSFYYYRCAAEFPFCLDKQPDATERLAIVQATNQKY